MDRYLTIFADASFCSRTGAGGWGAWIKGEGESITAGGSFRELHSSSQEAELAALVNAVSAAKNRNLLDPGLIVMLQSDCETALAAILRNRPQTVQRPIKGGHVIALSRRPTSKPMRKMVEELSAICRDAQVRVVVRHVKGHQPGGGRSWVNRQCDKIAYAAMSEARAAIQAAEAA